MILVLFFWYVPNTLISPRYAYLEGTGDDFDEEGISLTSGVIKMSGDVAAKLDRKERKGSSTTDLTYIEDVEEDKRE